MRIGEQLILMRKYRNMTQTKLAELSGVHENTICAYEKGRRSPTLSTLELLLDAMGFELAFRAKERK